MEEGTFVLKIELGNDGMQTPQDVAGALTRVGLELIDREGFVSHSRIKDGNGNSVGEWEVQ